MGEGGEKEKVFQWKRKEFILYVIIKLQTGKTNLLCIYQLNYMFYFINVFYLLCLIVFTEMFLQICLFALKYFIGIKEKLLDIINEDKIFL